MKPYNMGKILHSNRYDLIIRFVERNNLDVLLLLLLFCCCQARETTNKQTNVRTTNKQTNKQDVHLEACEGERKPSKGEGEVEGERTSY